MVRVLLLLCACLALLGADPARVLTNHLGYARFGPKRAVVQGSGGDAFDRFRILSHPEGRLVFRGELGSPTPVDRWKDWRFWELDFSELQREGEYVLVAERTGGGELRSFPFRIQRRLLERFTLSDVLWYFKGQRCSGALDRADAQLPLLGRTVDAHGGWYDATGDYGKHLSHLNFSTWHNPQQTPLVVYSLLRTHALLKARGDEDFTQFHRRLLDEAAWGGDFLVRMRRPGGSFYQSVSAPGPGKKPEDRRFGASSKGFTLKAKKPQEGDPVTSETGELFETGYRGGAGMAIAALAMAARVGQGGGFAPAEYLRVAEEAFAYLEAHNLDFCHDGRENLVDDTTALTAATELLRTTGKEPHRAAMVRRAEALLARLGPEGSWRADGGERPFFHAADAGLPLVALLACQDLLAPPLAARVREATRRALTRELALASEVPNPFGLARQWVQGKDGRRRTSFFYPHDAATAPWWQGENARLGSLASAARLALPLFAEDPAFQRRLQAYAADQLNWILGLNPFDACMLHGKGRNNPEYLFFGSYQYANAPGGICNGITGGYKDEGDIDFNLPHAVTGKDEDWRWGEQWLPHAAWYLLAVAADDQVKAPKDKVVVGYVFPEERPLDPGAIAAEKLTHLNYAFANVVGGQVVEGFRRETEHLRVLRGLKARNPKLKVLVSIGGWTWSGAFSDAALTPASRARFTQSALAYLRRHQLDGLDIDWEYPGLPGYGNVNRPEDKVNFTLLLGDLRAALDQEGTRQGRRLLLTIAAGALDAFLEKTEMAKASAHLDLVNLMTYDQCEAGADAIAGHHAPLFTHPLNPKATSAAANVERFLAAGVPAAKLVLGVPFYGRAWGGVRDKAFGLYQPGGEVQTRIPSSWKRLRGLVNKDGFTRHWDDLSQAPWLYHPGKQILITYEDEASLGAKVRYVQERGLAGVMFWEYSEDDGSLLEVIRKGFSGS